MKRRLVAGTINAWPDEDGWRTWTLDISPRGVWDRDLQMTVQPDFVGDITNLSMFRDEMFDEVRCHHVLEHLSGDLGRLALSEIHRIVVVGGCLDVEVPDLNRVCAAYCDGDIDNDATRQWLLGEQLAEHTPGDSHRFLWTEPELRQALEVVGYTVGERAETGLALRLIATRP